MPNTQYEAYQRQYEDTLIHLFENDRPYLIDQVTVDTNIEGMTKIYKRIGSIQGQEKTGRNEIAILDEPDYTARHLTVKTFYAATPIDMEDLFKMVTDPTDDLYTETKHALYDLQTSALMNGFFGDVIVTEAGGSTTSFPSANQVAVNFSTGIFGQNSGAADVGLNIDKIMKVKSLLSATGLRYNTSSSNTLNMAVTEDDIQSLMANKIGSDQYPVIDRFKLLSDSFEKAMLAARDGQFQWQDIVFHKVPPSYFLLNSSGNRRLPVWVKDGVVFGIKENVKTELEKLPNTVESWKVQALTRVGAMRKHDKKVFEIIVKP